MKHIQIHDFVKWELDMFLRDCNFTDDEREFFERRAKNMPIQRIAEEMNISIGKADQLSRKVKNKIIKVL